MKINFIVALLVVVIFILLWLAGVPLQHLYVIAAIVCIIALIVVWGLYANGNY